MKIKATFKPSIKSLVSKFDGFEHILARRLREGISKYSVMVHGQAIKEAPYDTGRLRSSISSMMDVKAKGLRAIIQPNVKYAIFVHEGTKPHVIKPRNKKALYWKGAEHPVKKVNHPGSRPNPFMERALNKKKMMGNKVMINKVNQALEDLSAKIG